MDDIDSNANVGDTVIFLAKNKTWKQGWEVIKTFKNEHNVTHEIIVTNGKSKRKIKLFEQAVYVLPPSKEVKVLLKELKQYPNLVLIRRRGTSPPTYQPFCLQCRTVVGIRQSTEEESEMIMHIGANNAVVSQSKPMISDGAESVYCGCDEDYQIEFDPY